jgi:arginyl-tRNA synthetase
VNTRTLLEARVRAALRAAGQDAPGLVAPAGKPEFGDYQANGIMGAAKRAGLKPRDLAERVCAELQLQDIARDVTIAGPGFLNITLADTYLREQLHAERTLLQPADPPQRVVVDYSSPNLAKEMHVGHLRSTIIGDSVARVLEALGHTVIRQNHVGDWGTQFGMLITELDDRGAALDTDLADLEEFYRQAKARFDSDPEFAERSRRAVVALQQGDAHARNSWQRFIDISMSHCQHMYARLGVSLERDDVMPESAYNDDLAKVVADLTERGLLTHSEGAACVFLDEFKSKDGTPLPLIVQKSDGGYLYATTDLAAIRHRANVLHADRALYFTDARQILHFRQVFAVARAAGFAPPEMSLEHMPFGTMLGKDGKPFKTRSGAVVRLESLLDEAVERAWQLVQQKNPALDSAARERIARIVGIGAIKYADLSKNRTSDYVFDWDQMIAFDGDTAPYLQYAYTRIRSLFRRADVAPAEITAPVSLGEPPERALAVSLLRFSEVVERVAQEGEPHFLCSYLYELATRYSQFYEQCPILNAEGALRDGRLALCARSGTTLRMGLALLGIDTVEQM